MKKNLRKIRIIFDIENWLWKSEIGIFLSLDLERMLIRQKMELVLFFTKLNYRCGSWWKIPKYPTARLMYNDFAHSYYSMQDKLLQHTEIHRALAGLLIEFLFWITCKEIRFHYPLSIYTWFLTFSSLMNLIFSLFQTWILWATDFLSADKKKTSSNYEKNPVHQTRYFKMESCKK